MWKELGLFQLFPLLGIFVALDAAIRFCDWLSKKLGLRDKSDTTLLILVVFLTAGLVAWLSHNQIGSPQFIDFRNVNDRTQKLQRDSEILLIENCILASIAISIPVVAILAKRQRRSLVVWVPLSLLGNAGSILWLLTRSKSSIQ